MKRAYIPLEELLPSSKKSVFKLTMLAAKRARNISEGSKMLTPRISEKDLDNAVNEISAGKVRVK